MAATSTLQTTSPKPSECSTCGGEGREILRVFPRSASANNPFEEYELGGVCHECHGLAERCDYCGEWADEDALLVEGRYRFHLTCSADAAAQDAIAAFREARGKAVREGWMSIMREGRAPERYSQRYVEAQGWKLLAFRIRRGGAK